jgi:predicted transcriptional regulator of viral defense system
MANFINFQKQLKKFTVFSLSDIRKVFQDFQLIQLLQWQKKGYIRKVIKGFYVFSDTEISSAALRHIANKIYAPSYISLETALSFYGIIPETVYQITSISTKKTKEFVSFDNHTFSYRSIKPDLFFDYYQIEDRNSPYFIAHPNKAIFDFLYLNRQYVNDVDFEELRLNVDIIREGYSENKFRQYLDICENDSNLRTRINNFIKFIQHAKS